MILMIRRQKCTSRAYFQLTEDDILCVARVVLPVVNTSLTKAQDIFSGDPSWTLKASLNFCLPCLVYYFHKQHMWLLIDSTYAYLIFHHLHVPSYL